MLLEKELLKDPAQGSTHDGCMQSINSGAARCMAASMAMMMAEPAPDGTDIALHGAWHAAAWDLRARSRIRMQFPAPKCMPRHSNENTVHPPPPPPTGRCGVV